MEEELKDTRVRVLYLRVESGEQKGNGLKEKSVEF
jgi:hypothetical protein